MLQKYFIAIVPPEPLLSEIQGIKQSIFENYNTKGALRSPGHITLHMPFSFEDSKEETLISCLETFRFNCNNSFSLLLDGFGKFEPRVIYINVKEREELFLLQKQMVQYIKQRLQIFNQADDRRGFHPHITVAFRDLKKTIFYKAWEEYETKPFRKEFLCLNFSILKHHKDHWMVLRTFQLKGM